MKKLLLIFSVSLLGIFHSFSQVTKTNSTAGTVNGSQATRTINFTGGDLGGCTSLTDIDVAINWQGGAFQVVEQIAMSIQSPTGTTVHLVYDTQGTLTGNIGQFATYDAGGFASWSLVTTTYDDDAGAAIPAAAVPAAGSWIPEEALSAFDGEDATGTWTLTMSDHTNNTFGDDFTFNFVSVTVSCAAACTDPTVPTVTHTPATVCNGGTASLNISGTLNDATAWHVYTGSCGGTQIGTTAGSTFAIPGTINSSTTYFVRGEGGCVTPGSCGSVTINPTALDNASFNYSAAAYCIDNSDPTPTITGLGGGSFSSTAGLSLNAGSGLIDVSTSTPGTYTVTYTTTGTCPNSSSVSVTINALDDASFSYSAASYCANDSDPTPTITGLGGGSFSSTAGLSLNAGSGLIDVSTSTPGTYTVTYTTAGTCPNSSSVSVTINALDDASFSYSAASYCANDSDPTPTITGLGGGTFSSGAGLSLNAGSGVTDVSASTPGTYTVTYTTTGACPNSSNTSVTINALDDASFSYSAASYCANDSDPTPTITGLGGGSFSSTAGLSLNAGSGLIDVSTSTPGTYTVTYTTAGTCPNSSSVSVTINALDDASFSYSAASYCANDSDPIPTITGLGGGTFSSGAGLSLNAGSGVTDVSASTPGTYTVTYTTTGTCPNSSSVSVTINSTSAGSVTALADLCINAGVQTGLGGGLPTGGVYSGVGITDAGNGTNYSFDPAAAGVGTHTITYTPGGGCSVSANDAVEVFALPSVTFTALADLCIDAGVQAGLGGGLPTGGVYSGPGVTDAGNGMTYSFDPAAAGVGTHTITYTFTNANGCTSSANDAVEVFALPTVTFTALADLCITDGVQAGLGSGTPTGGVYSGTGVTDNGNGMTYSFDPAAAGVGTHTITYTFTNANGCTNSAGDNVEVFAASTGSYTALADLCINAGVQAGLGGGLPTGGVYSGPGVTDAGNGTNYSFDPAAAGVGTHTVTYTPGGGCSISANDAVEVFALPTVTFTALADLCINAGVQAGLGGGMPTGGVYSGAGVTDDGNGMTYSFDPAAAGVGTHTITYTFTNANGCTSSANDAVEVFALPTVTFTALADLCITDGVQAGLGSGTPVGGVYSGAGVTDDGNGMTYSFDPAAAGVGTHTITYTFTNANGCTNSAADDVEVFGAAVGTFTALSDACIDAGVQAGLGGGLPTGGVYSGPGVTDAGNGTNYSFDPAAAGLGTHTITYTPGGGCSTSADDDVEVFDIPVVTFTAPGDVCPGSTVLTGQGNGLPTGGVYSGTGVSDDANGTTYSFDPSVAGSGTHTITYTFTNANSCSSVASDDITLEDNVAPVVDAVSLPTETATCDVVLTAPTATDDCSGSLTGTTSTVFPVNETTTVVWTFTDASGNSTMQTQDVVIDPVNVGIHVSPDDGQITSLNTDADVAFQWIDCADNSIIDGATSSYYLPTNSGMYALIVTQNGCTDTSDCATVSILGIAEADMAFSLSIFPNPTTDLFTVKVESLVSNASVIVYDMLGNLIQNKKLTSLSTEIDLAGHEAGTYFVSFLSDQGNVVRKVVLK